MRRVLAVCLIAVLAGCKVNEETRLKAIIGAVLIDGNGGPPITDSVVVISGSRIRSAGLRANVPIPAGSDKINGSGKFLVPGLVDLSANLDSSSVEKALNAYLYNGVTAIRTSVTDAVLGVRKSQRDGMLTNPRVFTAGFVIKPTDIAALAGKQVDTILAGAETNSSDAESILEEARKFSIPVTVDFSTLADAHRLVSAGAAGLLHTVRDTEEMDAPFLAKLRALKVVVTPALSASPNAGFRNTKRLAEAGVPIGIAGAGDTNRELELLAEAGLSPLEITAAATRNGALALRKLDELGTIEQGKRADFLLLNANPLEDVRNFRKIDQLMLNGEWIDRAALKTK